MSSLSYPQESKKNRFLLAALLGSLTALAPLAMDMYLPALPHIARDFEASTALSQLSLMACLIGLALGQLIAGPISDTIGRRKPLMIGLIIFIAASLLCTVVSSIWMFILLRLIQGLAGSAGIVIARAIVRDHYEGSEMTKFFALLMLVNGVAPAAAPIVGGQMLRFTTWQGVFVLLGILGALMLLRSIFSLQESLPAERRQTGGFQQIVGAMKILASDRLFVGYALSQGLVFAAMFAYISGSPFVLQELFHLSPQGFSAAFAVNSLGIITAGQVFARVAARIGEEKVLRIGLLTAALSGVTLFLMISIDAGLYGILIPLFFVVSSVGIVGTSAPSLAMQHHGAHAGSAAALIGVAQMLLGACMTPLVGLAGSQTAFPMGLIIMLCELGALGCYFFFVVRAKKRPA
ncbi:multidrug effflux MFS transporter [Bacillus pumilus]|uniref:multidrug effflux MFS transporter n=1 Tax=Bacillus pumilus TaxID=1408 RepID=UPI00145C3029|nr:multidrug effflux MFS transporter [Bacillus pumilus]MEB2359203.1 multidrug effflux MFS transporter [Bacillus pumilus]WLP60008.1 multidrug effflux MFS transporter [Bacillus pumilus]